MIQEEIEKEVMEMLLSGDDTILMELKHQYQRAKIVSRDFTGAGFFTTFSVPENPNMRVQIDKAQISDVTGTFGDPTVMIGFVLFIEKGVISFLEGYSLSDDGWPNNYDGIKLEYDSNGKRDTNKIKENWEIGAGAKNQSE